MENQIKDSIRQVLKSMSIPTSFLKEHTHIYLDLDMEVAHIDKLYATIERQYHLDKPLIYHENIATFSGLTEYILKSQSARNN
jgi:hypothetical protein